MPGTTMYPFSQLNQSIQGSHSYPALPGYAMPGHQIMQFGGPSVNAMTTTSVPTIPTPYPAGKCLEIFKRFLGILWKSCILKLYFEQVDLGLTCWLYQVLQHLFHNSHNSYYLRIHLNSCQVAVLTRMLGEGLI